MCMAAIASPTFGGYYVIVPPPYGHGHHHGHGGYGHGKFFILKEDFIL